MKRPPSTTDSTPGPPSSVRAAPHFSKAGLTLARRACDTRSHTHRRITTTGTAGSLWPPHTFGSLTSATLETQAGMGTALLSWWLCGSPCAPILQETPLKTSGLLRGGSPPPSLVSARLRPGWDQLGQQLRFVLSLLETEICTREPRDGRSAGFPTEDHRHPDTPAQPSYREFSNCLPWATSVVGLLESP